MLEDEIYTGLLNGKTAALEKLIKLYAPDVYKLVNRILSNLGGPADVEECCGDVFVAAWEKRCQYDPARAGLRTWVLILARYKALDYRRKLARSSETIPFQDTASPGTPEDSLLAGEERAAVMQTLSALPRAEREILYRRYYLEESVESIAAGLGISRGAADNRLWRARSALKKALQQDMDGKVVRILRRCGRQRFSRHQELEAGNYPPFAMNLGLPTPFDRVFS